MGSYTRGNLVTTNAQDDGLFFWFAQECKIQNGGSGYEPGQILSVVGGTLAAGDEAMQFRIDEVQRGVVTKVSLYYRGGYTAFPTPGAPGNSVATTVNAAGGTGARIKFPGADFMDFLDKYIIDLLRAMRDVGRNLNSQTLANRAFDDAVTNAQRRQAANNLGVKLPF